MIYFYFLCVYVFGCVCLCALHAYWILCSRRGHQMLQIWNYRRLCAPCGFWELNPVPLEEQPVLLISKLGFQPLNFIHIIYFDIFSLSQMLPDSAHHPNFMCVFTLSSRAVSNLFWEPSLLAAKPSLQT